MLRPRPWKIVDFIRKSGLLGSGYGRLGLRHQELIRVLRCAPVADLEVQVRPSRAAGRAHFAELAPALYHLALFHDQLRLVGVARYEVIAMVDVDHVAVLRVKAGEYHHAVRGRDDGRSLLGQKVDAHVHRPLTGEGIDAPTV